MRKRAAAIDAPGGAAATELGVRGPDGEKGMLCDVICVYAILSEERAGRG